MSNAGGECSVDGCPNLAARRGLCWGHKKREQRRRTVNVDLLEKPRTPWQRLVVAMYRYIDDIEAIGVRDPQAAERRAQSRFLMAKARYDKAVLRRSEAIRVARTGAPARNRG